MFVQLKFQLDVLYIYIFYSSLFLALHVSGAICTHPQEHKLQLRAICVCNGYGILIHWNRYWLGHFHTFSTVKSEADRAKSVRVSQLVPAPMD
jgi:hypothetical protein